MENLMKNGAKAPKVVSLVKSNKVLANGTEQKVWFNKNVETKTISIKLESASIRPSNRIGQKRIVNTVYTFLEDKTMEDICDWLYSSMSLLGQAGVEELCRQQVVKDNPNASEERIDKLVELSLYQNVVKFVELYLEDIDSVKLNNAFSIVQQEFAIEINPYTKGKNKEFIAELVEACDKYSKYQSFSKRFIGSAVRYAVRAHLKNIPEVLNNANGMFSVANLEKLSAVDQNKILQIVSDRLFGIKDKNGAYGNSLFKRPNAKSSLLVTTKGEYILATQNFVDVSETEDLLITEHILVDHDANCQGIVDSRLARNIVATLDADDADDATEETPEPVAETENANLPE